MVFLVLYIGTIFAANWAVATFGLIHVAPGLIAPAGVLFVGLAFTLRDLAHERLGVRWIYFAIIVGALLSAIVSPALALASGVAFGVSETSDLLIYQRVRRRSKMAGIALSNTVGAVVDSILFLSIAFGSLAFFWGQFVGKMEVTILTIIILFPIRRRMLLTEPA